VDSFSRCGVVVYSSFSSSDKSAKKNTIEPNSVAKTLRYPRRLSKKSDTVIISSPEEVFKTPSPSTIVQIARIIEAKSNEV
jgi:hypothetical protein